MDGVKSAFQTPLTIREVVDNIYRKRYLLPAIQREFVWSEEQIIDLFDSIMKDYPIGSFLFWILNKEIIHDFQFYEFINHYHERDNRHNPKANISGEEKITAILDGQQRLTSLYVALRGTYSAKLVGKRWDDDNSFPKRKLYLNLLAPAENDELLYDFAFKTMEAASINDEKNFWFEVGKVLEFTSLNDVITFLRKNSLLEPEFPQQALSTLYDVINNKSIINYYLEYSQQLDKVLNIFIRVNSGGTPLSYSDLLLSIATARWETKDAREEITEFVDEINDIGDGFRFDKDLIMKTCLVLSDITDISFKGDNFNVSNMLKIEQKWEDIKLSMRLATELVANFGYNTKTLTANYAIIPISYYLLKRGNPPNFVLSSDFRKDRDQIKRWVVLSLIKRVFSGQPDSVMRPLRNIIRDTNSEFPLLDVINNFKGTNKSLTFSEDDIETLLFSKYGVPHTFSILSLLYPTLDYRNRFHQDHIFANSLFKKSELIKRGIPESKFDFYLSKNDFVANLQLLEGIPNEEKSNKDFQSWLNETYTSNEERKEFLDKHHIPYDIDLGFHNFEDFFNERMHVIRTELRKILL